MYGENSGIIRSELSTLLRQHRIQQRIGGPGIHTVPVTTTVAEREEIARLIQRYRLGVLTWCHQALSVARPATPLYRHERAERPDTELRRILIKSMDSATASLPTLEDLSTHQAFPLVDTWRLAARAAALGEHDFAGDLEHGRLDLGQCMTLTKDAAEVIRAVVALDRRYRHVPGWRGLPLATRLERAAESCVCIEAADYTVDLRGRHDAPMAIDGPPRRGIAGVIQAEHNMLVHLHHSPNALNLRRLLDSQREISHVLAARACGAEPDLAARWTQRASTYHALLQAARDLGGSVGHGNAAVIEAANAISRLRRIPLRALPSTAALRDLDTLFTAVDHRLAAVIEEGARERVYFLKSKVPRLLENDVHLVKPIRTRFAPIATPMHTALVRLVRDELCPPRPVIDAPEGAVSRQELAEALVHRPGAPGRRSGAPHPSL